MKALIYVFSGTGNTLHAANKIKEELEEYDYEVLIEQIKPKNIQVPDANLFDLIGFGYPIHAFNTPQKILQYAKRLNKVNKIPTFIFKTSGEPFFLNKVSSVSLFRILNKKGYDVMMDTHMLMPYNIMFRYKDALAKQMYLHTNAMCKMIAIRAINKEHDKLHYNLLLQGFSLILRIQWFGAFINGPLTHVNKKKCINCGKCIKKCPNNNINLNKYKISFGWDCLMCMRCVMECPNDAIRPGFLNLWRVNGSYDFLGLIRNSNISDTYVNENTKGYFKLFKKYYQKTLEQMTKYGIKIDNNDE